MAEKKYILVKVKPDTHKTVKQIAEDQGMTLQGFINKALLTACKGK